MGVGCGRDRGIATFARGTALPDKGLEAETSEALSETFGVMKRTLRRCLESVNSSDAVEFPVAFLILDNCLFFRFPCPPKLFPATPADACGRRAVSWSFDPAVELPFGVATMPAEPFPPMALTVSGRTHRRAPGGQACPAVRGPVFPEQFSHPAREHPRRRLTARRKQARRRLRITG